MLWDSDEKIVLSQRLFCLRTNKRFDNRFIKYYLQSPTGKREVSRTRSGSTVAGISAEMFDQIQVLHPETRAQQRIAAVLSALDAKIDLNHRINAELEALANDLRLLVRAVRLPDAKGRPYKSSGGAMVWNDTLKREIRQGGVMVCYQILRISRWGGRQRATRTTKKLAVPCSFKAARISACDPLMFACTPHYRVAWRVRRHIGECPCACWHGEHCRPVLLYWPWPCCAERQGRLR
ncbi:MAG: restriction endonuclease subunit S [Lysobacterales bacterium]